MKLKCETPYIRKLELDKANHLWISYSDGIVLDLGYLPTDGITIQYKDKKVIE